MEKDFNFLEILKIFAAPFMYIVVCGLLYYYPTHTLNVVPNLIVPKMFTVETPKIKPIIPISTNKIMQINNLYNSYNRNDLDNQKYINEMSSLFSYDFKSKDEIENVINEMSNLNNDNNYYDKFFKMISFLNLTILFSTIGIIHTIIPTLIVVFGNFFNYVISLIIEFLIKISIENPQYGYTLCSFFLIQIYHCDKDIRQYLSLLNFASYYLLLFLNLHNYLDEDDDNNDQNKFRLLKTINISLPLYFLTMSLESYIFGSLSIYSIYESFLPNMFLMNFYKPCTLDTFVNSIYNSMQVSTYIIPIYFWINRNNQYKYFYYGVYVLSVGIYYIYNLVVLTIFKDNFDDQFKLIIPLIIGLYGGINYNIKPLYNLSIIFGFLYTFIKVYTFSLKNEFGFVYGFLFFVASCFLGIWIKFNPELLNQFILP